MTANDQYNPVPESRQDTDIISMLDEMLAQDNFFVAANLEGYELYEATADGDQHIDQYETRAAAYRGAIDCLIEACVFAWDQGGQE